MYEVYYNKQQARGHIQSPDTTQGFAQTPKVNEGSKALQLITTGFVASQIIPAGRQLFDTAINSRGNVRTKRGVNRFKKGLVYATIARTGSVELAIGTFIVSSAVEGIASAVDNHYNTINQHYEVQKRGVAIDKFAGIGGYYD